MQATTYEQFLEINNLPDTPVNKELYLDGMRRVRLWLAIEAIKAVGGDEDETL